MAENIINRNLQNIQDPDTEMNQMIQSPSNLLSVATGTGLHEQAMRDYLNPFSRNKNIQVGQGAVGDYMSNYLKDYIDPNNQAGGKFGERRGPNQMQVTGLGISPDPFSRTGIATAARLAEDPSFQAENLFGEGTLTQVPGGYDYTGGKFDFNFAGPLEEMIFGPSTYGMKFDKDMNTLNQFDRDFRAFDQAKMGQARTGDAISRTNVQGMDLEMDPAAQQGFLNPNIQPSQNMFQRAGNAIQGGLGSIRDFMPFIGDRSLTGMAMRGIGKVGEGIGNFFRGNPEQRARNEYNKQFSTGDIYGYGMGSASGANKDAFGYNTVSAFGNYEQHMIDTVEKLEDLLEKTGRTGFKPGTPNFNKLNTYTKNINKIQEDNRTKKEEAQKALERELAKYAAQNRIYGSGGGRDESLNTGPGGSYSGMGNQGATGANFSGDFATDSDSYDLKDGGPVGLASMFVRRR